MQIDEEVVRIVDDNDDQRNSIAFMLETEGYRVRAYASGREFLTQDLLSQPGCIVLDLQMPVMNGLEVQEELKQRDVKLPVLFFSAHGDLPKAVAAMKMGSLDFIEKASSADTLLQAVAKALEFDRCRRGATLSPEAARQKIAQLTEREQQITQLLARGLLKRQVASRLNISDKTVDAHCRSIYHKCKINSLAELSTLVNAAAK